MKSITETLPNGAVVTTVQSPADFPTNLPQMVVSDVETTSFGGTVNGLKPEQGARICGHGLGTLDRHYWYFPVRHSGPDIGQTRTNLPLDKTNEYMRDMLATRSSISFNSKFEGRALHADGIKFLDYYDVMVMGRLHHNDLFKYSLDNLSRLFCPDERRKQKDPIKVYLKDSDQDDYGAVPLNIMVPYSAYDLDSTGCLYEVFDAAMMKRTRPLWETERRLTSVLLAAEIKGFPVNPKELREVQRHVIGRLIEVYEAINEMAGWEVDTSVKKEVNNFLIGQLGLKPSGYTPKTREPKWDKLAYMQMEHPVGKLFLEMTDLEHYNSNFLEGWFKRMGSDNHVHGTFNQSGAGTGRMSSSDPNMQNIPPWAEEFIHPYPGYGLVAFDYSQIEYRMFAHYTSDMDSRICDAFNNDPSMDYHQWFADILGVHRQFAKQLNFSFLFGMGKEKLLRTLAAMLTASKDPKMLETMRALAYGAGTTIAERATRVQTGKEMDFIAEKVFNDYHKNFPAIKLFSKKVARTQRTYKNLINAFGRVYRFDEPVAHKGVNYLCQGTAADYVKDRTVALMEDVAPKYGAQLITTVHDSVITFVPLGEIVPFYLEAERTLTSGKKMRVPIYVEGKVGTKSWARIAEIGKNATESDILQAIAASDVIPARDYYGNQKELRASGRVAGT